MSKASQHKVIVFVFLMSLQTWLFVTEAFLHASVEVIRYLKASVIDTDGERNLVLLCFQDDHDNIVSQNDRYQSDSGPSPKCQV